MTVILVSADRVDLYPSGRQLPALPYGRPMAALLHQATRSFGSEGTVIVRPGALESLKLPPELPRRPINVPLLGEAYSLGWRGTKQLGSPWLTLYQSGHPTVHVLIWPYLTSGDPLVNPNDPRGTLHLLDVFQHQLGGAYHTTPGVTGAGLLRDVYAPAYKGAPAWAPDWSAVPPAAKDVHPEQALTWQAPSPPPGSVAHIYDATRARLRYAGTVKLAKGELQHMRAPKFSVKSADYLCGYWRISRPVWQVDGFPHPAGYRPESAQQVIPGKRRDILTEWVTTPTVELLMDVAEQGYIEPPTIWEGWLAPGGTLLRRWADALETAYWRTPQLQPVVKEIYRGTSGQMRRGSRRLDRPDWYHTWIAEERSRLWRKWWTAFLAGHAPLRIETDAVWYPTDDADWRTAMPAALDLGDGLGQFHPNGAWLLSPEGRPILDDDGDPILIETDWAPGMMPSAQPSITDHILQQRALRHRP